MNLKANPDRMAELERHCLEALALPWEQRAARLEQISYGEILRLIREEVPPPASRITQNRAIRKLDWILAKALEKDRNRRYQSAGAMAKDLRHYLDRKPLEAGPPSTAYRLRRLSARPRYSIATLIAAIVLCLAAIGGWVVLRRW
jgi:hypothetical protein